MNKDAMQKMTIRIPKDLDKKIDKLMKKKRLIYPTKSQVIRVAIDDLLKKEVI